MPDHRPTLAVLLAAAISLATGCATSPTADDAIDFGPLPSLDEVRALSVFSGATGAPMTWTEMIDAAEAADVIIIGEQHDDAVGHVVQAAVVTDLAARGDDVALALEMLERDEQSLVDDYLDGIIDAKEFAKQTFSKRWGGGPWEHTYQPVVDAAHDGGGAVIAANAPRRYVRLARTDGYERLEALPESRRRYFDLPGGPPGERYRERFIEVMTPAVAQHGSPDPVAPLEDAPDSPEDAPEESADDTLRPADEAPDETAPEDEEPLMDETMAAMFRSQRVWDATMAASIARGLENGARKVVHLVGQFHSDFEGGTVHELRQLVPEVRVLVISMQRADGHTLRDDDRDRADVIIYTGAETDGDRHTRR